mmetsp:Transcript_27518/g.50798  ORF Transcript_27518/g.50798 Transcript_27518/m.50798 type:complete len:97 (+) Transcript_27518:1838-2128(+)
MALFRSLFALSDFSSVLGLQLFVFVLTLRSSCAPSTSSTSSASSTSSSPSVHCHRRRRFRKSIRPNITLSVKATVGHVSKAHMPLQYNVDVDELGG